MPPGTLWVDVGRREWSAHDAGDDRPQRGAHADALRGPRADRPAARRGGRRVGHGARAGGGRRRRQRGRRRRCRRRQSGRRVSLARNFRRAVRRRRRVPAQSRPRRARLLPRLAGPLAPDVGDAVGGELCGVGGHAHRRAGRRRAAGEGRGPRTARRAGDLPALPVRRTDAAQRSTGARRAVRSHHDSDAAAIGQAVLEGVAFGFADGLDALDSRPAPPSGRSRSSAAARARRGGAGCWRRRCGVRWSIATARRSVPAYGAARLARLGVGGEAIDDVCVAAPVRAVIEPDDRDIECLAGKRDRFARLYQDLRARFRGE